MFLHRSRIQRISTTLKPKFATLVTTVSGKENGRLPTHNNVRPTSCPPMGGLLGHCHYRRVTLWTFAIACLLVFAVLNSGVSDKSRNILRLHVGKASLQDIASVGGDSVGGQIASEAVDQFSTNPPVQDQTQEVSIVLEEEPTQDEDAQDRQHVSYQTEAGNGEAVQEEQGGGQDGEGGEEVDDRESGRPRWLRYKHLDGYYRGLRALVHPTDYKPEYPGPASIPTPASTPHHTRLPTPVPYRPYPDYNSEAVGRNYVKVSPCYVDAKNKTLAPDVHAYYGIVQGQPEASLGSYEVLGLRSDICFDRFGRYGPYGLGYGAKEGGAVGINETESQGSQAVWEASGQIDWSGVDWAAAQSRCLESNRQRFFTGNETLDAELAVTGHIKLHRTAIVVRTYVGFKWTEHAVLNFRAMVSELNLRSGGEYDVHFLFHVRDNNAPIWADSTTAQDILDANVPAEFHGLCTLWSEALMRLYYPGNFGDSYENPSNGDIHGVYRSAHMALQYFAMRHPEYKHFWNWEMDMRWLGSYYELFDRIGKWAAKQSRVGAWERAARYYIPGFHGAWENFTNFVQSGMLTSGKKPILGPIPFAGRVTLQQGETPMPDSCADGIGSPECGVGEDADLIALNPIFDVEDSGWVFASDVTGYDTTLPKPPRRCSIVTASRLSRRLLTSMHEETWRLHHSMFSEMFPASVALHRGLKAVYAPHPVYIDRDWPQGEIDRAFNGGEEHSTSGRGSPFDLNNEHNHKGTSWYYNSEFAGLLWRRWLGYAQMDGCGRNGGRAGEGTLRGGRDEEEDPTSSGRLCLRSMLVHPIKWEDPAEREF
ncbi:hypothetical protein F5Y17DRAFT_473271 [Xylariaceae sp. FL0594]|nr:hypothetical protein F5Y17DRAFT_473271 [Xylariaceae sp. FL0594]